MPQAGKNGNKYVPYEERKGNESIVYFTRDISPEGMMKAYEKVKILCTCISVFFSLTMIFIVGSDWEEYSILFPKGI